MSIDFNEEKLLCLMVQDDRLASRLSSKAGPAFWRAFILENRQTHRVSAQFRFRYQDEERNWFRIDPSEQPSVEVTAQKLRCSLEDVQKIAMRTLSGLSEKEIENAIECFYPPDDEGDFLRTLIWLEQRNLIEIEVKRDGAEEESDPKSVG